MLTYEVESMDIIRGKIYDVADWYSSYCHLIKSHHLQSKI